MALPLFCGRMALAVLAILVGLPCRRAAIIANTRRQPEKSSPSSLALFSEELPAAVLTSEEAAASWASSWSSETLPKPLRDATALAAQAAKHLPGVYSDWATWSELIYLPERSFVLCAIPKVASTVWKQMALRIMGIDHWDAENTTLIHHPSLSRLHVLGVTPGGNPTNVSQQNISELQHVFHDRHLFKVAFVRDPITRFLSSYLDRCVDQHEWYRCLTHKQASLAEVVAAYERRPVQPDGTDSEVDVHFRNQTAFCGLRHLSFCNYSMIARYETMAASSQALLKHMGLWETFGQTGWGPHRNTSFMLHEQITGNHLARHMTENLVCNYYNPELLLRVSRLYHADMTTFVYRIQHWLDMCGWSLPPDAVY